MENPFTSEAEELIRDRPLLAREIARQIYGAKPIPTRAGLTARQRELLGFITSYSREHGISPSYDEMTEFMDLRSKSGINRLVTALEERGHITRLPHNARSIAVMERA